MQIARTYRPRARRGFTMIEIAIALGVIGFALVAIIGILPFGLNVQKESHQDTVIGQDGPFFLNAIRDGGVAGPTGNGGLDFLTNYVESIQITVYGKNGVTSITPPITSGKAILGALSTPEYYFAPNSLNPTQTNIVLARVRALSGNALEQDGANSVVAFRYFMTVEILPFASTAGGNINLLNNLTDIHVKFSWPVSGVGTNLTVGPGRAHFRTMVSGQLVGYTNGAYIYWYMQPNSYSTNSSLF